MTPPAAFAEQMWSALGFGAFIGLEDLGEPTDETIVTPLFPQACKFGVVMKDTLSSQMQVVLFNWQQLTFEFGQPLQKDLRQIRQFKWLRSIVGHDQLIMQGPDFSRLGLKRCQVQTSLARLRLNLSVCSTSQLQLISRPPDFNQWSQLYNHWINSLFTIRVMRHLSIKKLLRLIATCMSPIFLSGAEENANPSASVSLLSSSSQFLGCHLKP